MNISISILIKINKVMSSFLVFFLRPVLTLDPVNIRIRKFLIYMYEIQSCSNLSHLLDVTKVCVHLISKSKDMIIILQLGLCYTQI